jgi:hypothetical protein
MPGPSRHESDPRAARHAGEGIGHVSSRRLMPGIHDPDPGFSTGDEDQVDMVAGEAEDLVNPLAL